MSEDKMGTERSMQEWPSSGDFRTSFFALTFLLSLPFYILHALAHLHILGKPAGMPLVSAAILAAKGQGRRGVKELARRIFDFKRIAVRRWYVPVIFLGPLILLLSIGGMVLSGAPLPPAMTPLMALPAVFVLFFLMATGEEVGWMGYAFEPMEARAGTFRAALVLGVIWALWHVPIFVFVIPDPIVAGAQLLILVGNRVLVAWLFNNTGKSVFAAILFHAVDNTALVSLPDINAMAPWGTITLCGLTLIAVAIVTFLWGPRTLTRYRFDTGAREVPNDNPT
jgi:membrane protease YdiL (CAAX protease family)